MAPPLRSRTSTIAACAGLLVVGFVGARWATARAAWAAWAAKPPPAASVLAVPHLTSAIVLDGDQDDPGWRGEVARTGPFLGPDGAEARPMSQVRAVWGDGHLYLSLYAADEDLRASERPADSPPGADDSFHLTFTRGATEWDFDVSVTGVITDGVRSHGGAIDFRWDSGAHVSVERDGTLDDPRDDDEEWLLELAIPLDALGLDGGAGSWVGFAVERCDTLKSGAHVCAAWGGRGEGVLELE